MNSIPQNDWNPWFMNEIQKPYFQEIQRHLAIEKQKKYKIYPAEQHFFQAFHLCSLAHTKVVIIGQDPYHQPNQAMGLSFSVPKTQKTPPSLRNIFKAIQHDIPSFNTPSHGDLTNWANQGVLLLNATLSVRHQTPNAHKKFGWQTFTNNVIQHISSQKQNVVFLLWGAFAQSKELYINAHRHLILKAPHPSPFSAHKGFLTCQHFMKTNTYLQQHNKCEINWTKLD